MTNTATAYDFSDGPIAPAALLARDVRLVMRYLSTPGNPKNITSPEYRSYVQAGIPVGLNYETTDDWMLGGYSAGLAAARSARAQAVAVGYPSWYPIWYSADLEADDAQIEAIVDCLHGCADAEGNKTLVQVYGDYDVAYAAAAAGFTRPWQTSSWSHGRWSTAAVIRQLGTQTTCGGVQVDINEVISDPFPTTNPAAAAAPTEDDDMSTTSVNGRAGLSWAGGTRHVVQVTYDPNLGDPALRVVLALPTGPWVAPEWKLSKGSGTYEIPVQYRSACRGVILEGAATPVYDATAV